MTDDRKWNRGRSAHRFVSIGMAGIVIGQLMQPFDMVKTRMQMAAEVNKRRTHKHMLHCLWLIGRAEGLSHLYGGISAALTRQAIFTTVRVGMYVHWRRLYVQKYGREPDVLTTTAMTTSGSALGAIVGTPAEVVLVRMTADGLLPPAERRNYRNVFHGMKCILCAEGVPALFRGIAPTTCRAVVGVGSQAYLYTVLKAYLCDSRGHVDGLALQAAVGVFTGIVTCVLSLPFDMAKTRIQAMRVVDGQPRYNNSLDVIRRVCQQEGCLALWKGFVPYFLRPHSVFMFVFLEELRRAYRRDVIRHQGTDI